MPTIGKFCLGQGARHFPFWAAMSGYGSSGWHTVVLLQKQSLLQSYVLEVVLGHSACSSGSKLEACYVLAGRCALAAGTGQCPVLLPQQTCREESDLHLHSMFSLNLEVKSAS